jgi:hypothetical protein
VKDKIKDFFRFLGRAWTGGIRGKAGILCALFALFMFVGIFSGDVSAQKFVFNIWKLHSEEQTLAAEQEKLEKLERHIKLLHNYSPDFVEELGLKYLNLGDSGWRVLKI